MTSMQERLRERISRPGASDRLWVGASFLESLIVPIPIELVMIPYMIRRRQRIWWTATLVLAGCVLGALIGYAVGALFMQSVGQWLIDRLDWQGEAALFYAWFDRWGFWAIVAVGITPVPFQIALLSAGAANYPLFLFVLATILARGTRYYGVALLVVLLGDRALDYWKARSARARIAMILAFVVFVVIMWLRPATS